MQKQSHTIDVGISIKMVDARSVKRTGTADDPVNFVALLKQQIGQITPVLAGNAGDKHSFHFRQ
jgi:hypothetical protein